MNVRYLEDRIVKMSHTVERGKVHVSFAREPLLLWVQPARVELLEALARAVEAGAAVSVAHEADTQEILSVRALG